MSCKSCEEARKAVKRKLKYIAGKLSWARKGKDAKILTNESDSHYHSSK